MFDEYFYYSNGKLFWKVSRRGHVKADDEVCNLDGKGYIRVVLKQKFYLAHRVIYELHYGAIPEGYQIDHIDGDKLNNDISNLRLATNSINQRNKKKSKRNTSGVTGVCFDKNTGKWLARVCKKQIGKFDSIEEACNARNIAKEKIGGFSSRHGK